MKKLFFITTLAFFSLQVSAQFKLVTKLGREFSNIKILSHNSDYIRFKRMHTGSIMKIYSENILQLSHNNKIILVKDSLLLDSLILNNHLRHPLMLSKHRLLYNRLDSVAKKIFLKGNMDAQLYYSDHASSPLIAVEGAVFSSVVSLITATVVSHKVPDGIHLFTNDNNQFDDKNYLFGYQSAALKIKRGKVWEGFFTGLTANVVTATTVLILLR